MSRRITTLIATAATAGALTAGALAGAGSAGAATPPDHHTVICQSATFYAHYVQGSGPADPIRTLGYGNDVGHTYGSGEGEQAGWVYALDYGPNDWGWVESSCLS